MRKFHSLNGITSEWSRILLRWLGFHSVKLQASVLTLSVFSSSTPDACMRPPHPYVGLPVLICAFFFFFFSAWAHTLIQMHTHVCMFLCEGLRQQLSRAVKVYNRGLEAVAAGCMWVTITSRASRMHLSTPASRAAERGPGIYTHNYHSLLHGFKRLTGCVCLVCVCVMCCAWWYLSECLCGFGTVSPLAV